VPAGEEDEVDGDADIDMARAVGDLGAVKAHVDAIRGADGAKTDGGVEIGDHPGGGGRPGGGGALEAGLVGRRPGGRRPVGGAGGPGPGSRRPVGGAGGPGQGTILEIGSSMMSVAPLSFRAGIRMLMSCFGTTASTA
jgi:hypothetical protein